MYVCENSAVHCIRYLDLEPILQIVNEFYLLDNWITFYCDCMFNIYCTIIIVYFTVGF
jgi:hypothetical protein